MEKFGITTEQSEYLATLFHNQNMLILGSAGTGKSILALEAIKRQIAEDSNCQILYLCSNNPFKQQMWEKISLIEGNLKSNVCIDTFRHCFDLNFNNSLNTNKEKIMRRSEYLYQFTLIIIDEAQELQSELLYELKILANHSKLYIFRDEKQQIQNQNDSIQALDLQNNLEIPNPIILKKNYRNPHNIVQLAQKISPLDYKGTSFRTDDSNVYIKCVSDQEKLIVEINKFERNHIHNKIITILPDRWKRDYSIFASLEFSNWLTVKQSLGIEYESIIIVVETVIESNLSTLLYTAITRTLGDLEIIFYFGKAVYKRNYIDQLVVFKKSELNKLLLEFQTEEDDDL